ncbi:MAG: hypothetical protein KAH38_08840, partial [Candidatus Hydrogenedentes bacterium]|nr:hypothetical protein [Candidatus Hydrogenedentota bacterium]
MITEGVIKNGVAVLICLVLLLLMAFGAQASYRVWRIGNTTNTNMSSGFKSFGNDVAYRIGYNLFRTDGTAGGTIALTDGLDGFKPIACYGDYVYYCKYYDGYGNELGRSNGTAGNDELFLDLVPGSEGSSAAPVSEINGMLLLSVKKSLYTTNGTPGPATLIYDFSPVYSMSSSSQYPRGFVKIGDYVYFCAGYVNSNHGIWRTDGTTAGTIPLIERSDAPLGDLVKGDGVLFFSEEDDTGVRLWISNGTVSGTQMLKSFPLSGPFGTTNIVSTSFDNGLLWFGVYPLNELWQSNGTGIGTRQIATFSPLPMGYGTQLKYMLATGSHAFFTAAETDLTQELWQSDGTSQGTLLVQNAGLSYSNVSFEGRIFGKALFNANHDGAYETWTVDGTDTINVADLVEIYSEPFPYKGVYLAAGKEGSNADLYGVAEMEPMQFLQQPRPNGWYYPGDDLDICVEISLWAQEDAEYQWYKDDVPIVGEQSPNLNIPMLTFDDSGIYFCRVTLADKEGPYDSIDASVRVFAEGSVPVSSPL